MNIEIAKNKIYMQDREAVFVPKDAFNNMYISEKKWPPEIRKYLENLVTVRGFKASGIRISSFTAIIEENMHLVPGGILWEHDFLTIASSIGGNALLFDLKTLNVYWADHTSFSEDDEEINYQDRRTGDWKEIHGMNRPNIIKAMVPISENFEQCLNDILDNKYEEYFDRLD